MTTKKLISPLHEADLPADLAALLRPRVERLGYLGEFFRYAAHQPKALMSFLEFTEDLKQALPENLTEVVALSVARLMENDYERVQHERLALKRGLGEPWLRAVLSLASDGGGILSQQEIAVQGLVMAVVARKGQDCAREMEAATAAIGPAMTIAVLMLIGRYVTHAMIVNTLELAPPVPSPLENIKLTTPEQTHLWISEADVVAMMDMRGAVAALENGLRAEAQGDAINMVKTHVEWGEGATLHAIGAVFPKVGIAGTKTWLHNKGATPLLVLFDSNNGALKAIIEAFALGQMRTAAASGVATQWLAAPDADEFAIIGTGKQAITQVAAVLAVRPIRRVRVFGRNEERRKQFAARVKSEFGVEAAAAASVREAVKDVPIITLVTRATEPIVSADMVARGAHINAIGAIVPSRAEAAGDVLPRCTQIVADSIPQAQKLSRELIEFCGSNPAEWAAVQSLASVVAQGRSRAGGDDITLFKSLGMGISDLSLGIELYKKALDSGRGQKLPHPQRVSPRLRTTQSAKV